MLIDSQVLFYSPKLEVLCCCGNMKSPVFYSRDCKRIEKYRTEQCRRGSGSRCVPVKQQQEIVSKQRGKIVPPRGEKKIRLFEHFHN